MNIHSCQQKSVENCSKTQEKTLFINSSAIMIEKTRERFPLEKIAFLNVFVYLNQNKISNQKFMWLNHTGDQSASDWTME